MKKLLLISAIVCTAALSGCMTGPDGRKGVGVAVPIKIKETDCGAVVFGWLPPDTVVQSSYVSAAKAYIRPL